VFGSHVDSVPNGGNFDGALGVLASIGVIDALNAATVVTRHPLEVVVWTNEEGVAFGNGLDGSRAAAGERTANEADQVWNGTRKGDAIKRIGGDPDRIGDARRQPGSVHCYLELHIEQGGTLDHAGIPIGIVEGIVAIDRYEAVVTGTPNHAGTTPMPMRQDALVAAARLVLAVQEIVTSEPGRQVGTVGQLNVTPNAPNVIPGSVRHTIELRDVSQEKIARLADRIRERAAAIGRESGVTIAISPTSRHAAAMAHPVIQQTIEHAADAMTLAHRRLPSGAGHDAQMMATLGPMGMIFVPSVGSISHSPREFTRFDDCARGTSVLLETVLAMDQTTVGPWPGRVSDGTQSNVNIVGVGVLPGSDRSRCKARASHVNGRPGGLIGREFTVVVEQGAEGSRRTSRQRARSGIQESLDQSGSDAVVTGVRMPRGLQDVPALGHGPQVR
jgi:N-carbamoyl-L-amino-acid hydrolase